MSSRHEITLPAFAVSSAGTKPAGMRNVHPSRSLTATRLARHAAGLLLLASCLGQSCDIGPLFGGGDFTGGDVLGFRPDKPPSDDTADTPLAPAGDDTPAASLIADAGAAMIVMEAQDVTLQGVVTGGDGSTPAYSWRQTAGPKVLLMGTSSLTPRFTAPPVLADSVMTFQFTVTAGAETASDTIDITVINVLSPKITHSASPKQGSAPLQVVFTAKSATISPLPEGT